MLHSQQKQERNIHINIYTHIFKNIWQRWHSRLINCSGTTLGHSKGNKTKLDYNITSYKKFNVTEGLNIKSITLYF